MASLNGVNPSLERAAMSLGANRLGTFLQVTLPLAAAGDRRRLSARVRDRDQRLCDAGDPGWAGDAGDGDDDRDLHDPVAGLGGGSAMGAILLVTSVALVILTSRWPSAAGADGRRAAAALDGAEIVVLVIYAVHPRPDRDHHGGVLQCGRALASPPGGSRCAGGARRWDRNGRGRCCQPATRRDHRRDRRPGRGRCWRSPASVSSSAARRRCGRWRWGRCCCRA